MAIAMWCDVQATTVGVSSEAAVRALRVVAAFEAAAIVDAVGTGALYWSEGQLPYCREVIADSLRLLMQCSKDDEDAWRLVVLAHVLGSYVSKGEAEVLGRAVMSWRCGGRLTAVEERVLRQALAAEKALVQGLVKRVPVGARGCVQRFAGPGRETDGTFGVVRREAMSLASERRREGAGAPSPGL